MNKELYNAIDNNNLEKVKEIITKNPGILCEKICNLKTPLENACNFSTSVNRYKIVKFLLQYKHDNKTKNNSLEKLITYSFGWGLCQNTSEENRKWKEIIELLLKNGADINGDALLFESSLHVLFYQLRFRKSAISEEAVMEIVNLLIKYGANPNIKDKWNRTSIDRLLEAYKKNDEENIRKTIVKIIELLLDNNLIDLNKLKPKYKLFKMIFQYEKNREIEKLKKEIKKLKKKNEELRYAPGNAGYFEAMDDFDKLKFEKKIEK